MASKKVLAFDLYGTLLSTESISRHLESHFPTKAQSISALWRRYQLEYTWRLNSMGTYEPFSAITRNSLGHALAEHSESLSDDATDALMAAYNNLSTFADVQPTLTELAKIPTVTPVVFSNGTREMLASSVLSSPDLSPHASVFADILSVGDVGQYKPAAAVYYHLAEKTGKRGRPGDVWLVSGNPFDIVGARSAGMNAIWVDRSGAGWADAAVPRLRPSVVVSKLDEAVGVIQDA
ncbi:HAD-like domain-containing protein [Aspergillus aurantiobrunneus]